MYVNCSHDAYLFLFMPRPNDSALDEDSEGENEGEPEEEMPCIRSIQEALEAARQIRAYLLSTEVQSSSLFSSSVQLETDLLQEWSARTIHCGRQTVITDFFRR